MTEKRKEVAEIVDMASTVVKESIKKPFESVIGVSKEKGGGWKILVEVLERKAIPDGQDLIGRYEFSLDEAGELQGFNQVRVRRRSDREGVEFMT